jgi:hypothetical protein
MSSRKSPVKRSNHSGKRFLVEARHPKLYVISEDKLARLKECNHHKHFALATFYFSLLFSGGISYLFIETISNQRLIIFLVGSIILIFLFIYELINYLRKKDIFNKILQEIEDEEAKIYE